MNDHIPEKISGGSGGAWERPLAVGKEGAGGGRSLGGADGGETLLTTADKDELFRRRSL